ncbi:DoxX family protein [Intrasporangium mesophilum]
MEPVFALTGVTIAVLILTRLWLGRADGLELALRAGVGVMFTLTGVAHFVGVRAELIAMVPESLPFPGLLVTVTGVLELAAAAAMLRRRVATVAAAGLTLLLLVMFAANVTLARPGAQLPWWDQLLPRTVMQLLFLTATISVFLLTRRPGATVTKKRRAREAPPAGFSTAQPGDTVLEPVDHRATGAGR